MYHYLYIFLMFIFYSFCGWIVDTADILLTRKQLVNRGFLLGPICPIYGVGVLLMIFLLSRFTDTPLALFILAIFIFMTLEYLTSYLMEKLFNARWWDYTDQKFNLNGRICLETTIPFGLGGMLVMYVINPFITKMLDKIPHNIVIILGIVFLVIFIVDVILSFSVIAKIKKAISMRYKGEYKDDTEEVNKKVRAYLIKLSPLTKRLMESFPNVRIKLKQIKEKTEKKLKKSSKK